MTDHAPSDSSELALTVHPSRWSGFARTASSLLRAKDTTGGVLSVLDQAIVSAASFVTTMIVGRALGQHDLGTFYLALSLVFLARGIQAELLEAPYMVLHGRVPRFRAPDYTGSALIHQMFFALAIGIGIGVGAFFGPDSLRGPLTVVMVAAPCILVREFVRKASFAHLHLRAAIVLDTFASIAQVGSLMVLMALGLLSVPVVYAVMGGVCLIACAGWFVFGREPMRFTRRRIVPDLKRNWVLAKWGLMSHLLGASAPLIVPWIVAYIHGEATTGVFAACITLVGVSNIYIHGIANYLGPRASHAFTTGGREATLTVLLHHAALMLIALGVFCAVILVFGDTLVAFLFGDSFAGYGVVVSLLAISVLIKGASVIAGNALWALEHPRANVAADLIVLIVCITAALVLIPTHALVGAAVAILSATAAGTVLRVGLLWRVMSFEHIREGRTA